MGRVLEHRHHLEGHPDGSGLTKLFEDADGRFAITPTWSPDGQFVMFALDPPGTLPIIDVAPPNGLFVVRADGTDLTLILSTDDWKREPDWAPA
jgi:Tol biopolymer transport system component